MNHLRNPYHATIAMNQSLMPQPSRLVGSTGFSHNGLPAAICVALFAVLLAACGENNGNKPPSDVATLAVAESPLSKAALQGNLDELKTLLAKEEANINAKDALGRTPLHMAAFYGQLQATELLISSGAKINARDNVGMTPLHAAVLSGGRKEVELLLNKGADIGAKSDTSQTPLHLAASTGQPKLSKFLIEKGADPQDKDADGKTPLFYATQNQHPQTTALLKQYVTTK